MLRLINNCSNFVPSFCFCYQEHVATHTGIDLYKCAYCEATFKSKSNRSTHCRRHHPVEYKHNMLRRPRPDGLHTEKLLIEH